MIMKKMTFLVMYERILKPSFTITNTQRPQISDSSMTDYCTHIKYIVNLLKNIDAIIQKKLVNAYY